MEAFTAAQVVPLTIYHVCKAVDRDMVKSDIKLLEKSGGKSGGVESGGVNANLSRCRTLNKNLRALVH